jgi:Asp-tRNA(Asn)/Glu-tRNA(Gln) amidotransferase A subunit family amidase
VDLTRLTAHELTDAFGAGTATPTAAAEAYLARITALDGKVRAYLTVTADLARRAAAAADARYRAGTPLGPLDGVPIAVKDSAHVAGWPLRFGSHATSATPSAEDTPGVARLREAGAVFFCKTTNA